MTSVPVQIPNEWSSDVLMAKAQKYAEEMHLYDQNDWKFSFWSTLTLELLARAALAHKSPVLLADSKERNNLIYAIGITPNVKKFVPKSIDISEVFNRLVVILPEFREDFQSFSVNHMMRRNSELHSGQTPFDGLTTSAWLPLFYEVCNALVSSMSSDLPSFLGPEFAKVANKMIDAFNDESAKKIKKNIEAHKLIWKKIEKGDQGLLQNRALLWASPHGGHRVKCPACGCDAIVTGEPFAPPQKSIVEDLITETQQFIPSKFECIACDLKINGFPQLAASGLGDSYKATFSYNATDYYLRDEFADYEPDYNEP